MQGQDVKTKKGQIALRTALERVFGHQFLVDFNEKTGQLIVSKITGEKDSKTFYRKSVLGNDAIDGLVDNILNTMARANTFAVRVNKNLINQKVMLRGKEVNYNALIGEVAHTDLAVPHTVNDWFTVNPLDNQGKEKKSSKTKYPQKETVPTPIISYKGNEYVVKDGAIRNSKDGEVKGLSVEERNIIMAKNEVATKDVISPIGTSVNKLTWYRLSNGALFNNQAEKEEYITDEDKIKEKIAELDALDAKPTKEEEEVPSEQDLQKRIFNQLQDHLGKIGITIHNKAEMDTFLIEHGVDGIQALFNNSEKEVLSNVPEAGIADSREYALFIQDAYRHQDRVVDGIGWANTADNYYIYDLDKDGFPTPKLIIPITDANIQRISALVNNGGTLSESDERTLKSFGIDRLHEGTTGAQANALLSDIAGRASSDSSANGLGSATNEQSGKTANVSSDNGTSDINSEEYQRESNRISREIGTIVLNAKKKGTLFKAPNGKKSNLSPMQWIMVRTKNFKDWFGDWEKDPARASKVVDENGEPLAVYHSRKRKDLDFYEDTLGYFSSFK